MQVTTCHGFTAAAICCQPRFVCVKVNTGQGLPMRNSRLLWAPAHSKLISTPFIAFAAINRELDSANLALSSLFPYRPDACLPEYGQTFPNKVTNIFLCYHVPFLTFIACFLENSSHKVMHPARTWSKARRHRVSCSVGTAASQSKIGCSKTVATKGSLARQGLAMPQVCTKMICRSLCLRCYSSFLCRAKLLSWSELRRLGVGVI